MRTETAASPTVSVRHSAPAVVAVVTEARMAMLEHKLHSLQQEVQHQTQTIINLVPAIANNFQSFEARTDTFCTQYAVDIAQIRSCMPSSTGEAPVPFPTELPVSGSSPLTERGVWVFVSGCTEGEMGQVCHGAGYSRRRHSRSCNHHIQ